MTKILKTLLVRTGITIKIIAIPEINYISAEGAYSIIYFRDSNDSMVICKSLKKLEELLSENSFYRCHKSTIVNIEYIDEIRNGKEQSILMEDGTIIKMSKRGKINLLKLLRET